MMKKVTFLVIFISLFINGLVFSQTENPYADFEVPELQTHKEYSKNFNPSTFKEKILYNCMVDLINAARAQYTYAAPLSHIVMMDSTAQMQADYQARKEEKTAEGESPYKTTDQRLRKYGLTPYAEELVSKAKSNRGIEEYSYYDICMEWLKPILRNMKLAQVLLDKKYCYIGFGHANDQYMKNVYASIILGNDRTLNPGKNMKTVDNQVLYSKKLYGLKPFDLKVCQKCNNDMRLEVLSQCIQIQRDEVYFVYDDYKYMKKLIGKEGDAIALDFIQENQYECGAENIIDNNRVNRGFMTKPITFEELLARNEVADKKSTKISAIIATIPAELDRDYFDFDINVILVKEGKYACRTILKKKVECNNAYYDEKISFLKDEISIPTTGDWLPAVEQGQLEIKIPLTSPTKTDFSPEEVASYVQQLDEPSYKIDKVEVIMVNSIEKFNDPAQQKLQKKRGESLANAIKGKYGAGLPVTISYEDSWEEFKKELVYSAEYYDLTLFGKENAVSQLTADKGKIAKEIEKDYLSKQRFAKVIFHVTYNVEGKNEQDFVVYKFNKSLAQGKTQLAMAIQKYIIKQVEEHNYNSNVVKKMKIPVKKANQAMLNNKIYLQCITGSPVSNAMCTEMDDYYKLDVNNRILEYNKMLCDMKNLTLTSTADVANKQANIDKFYAYPTISKEKVNSLNMSFQLKVLEYLKTVPKTTENLTLADNTYAKIKTVRNPKLDSWQEAYHLAAIFIRNNDYAYALSLMDPFILDGDDVSDDFIFAYVSIGGYKEDSYLSGNYAKAVEMAAQRDKARLCALFEKMSMCILDNRNVKKVFCKDCK